MTNEELIKAFPECMKIRKWDMKVPVEQAMGMKHYREIYSFIMTYLHHLWPEPTCLTRKEKAEAYHRFFYGDFKSDRHELSDWIRILENEFLERHGQHRTFEEACQIAADKWVEMIFGFHLQNNGDTSNTGGLSMALGTIVKDRAVEKCPKNAPEKARELLKKHYLNDCLIKYKDDMVREEPYCDYHPNYALSWILRKAGCDANDVANMCPWKTGVSVDRRDNSVIVRGYQKQTYI